MADYVEAALAAAKAARQMREDEASPEAKIKYIARSVKPFRQDGESLNVCVKRLTEEVLALRKVNEELGARIGNRL